MRKVGGRMTSEGAQEGQGYEGIQGRDSPEYPPNDRLFSNFLLD
jgi:hypothetical protein